MASPKKRREDGVGTFEDDADEGTVLSKEEERERKLKLQAKIRKEQADGPPPDMKKRQLIFDSLSKIISRTFGKGSSRQSVNGETRGTYIFTWGAGYHGQLGRQFERGRKKYATIPKMVHLDIAVRQISCGGLHTAAVTDAGSVFTWGDARAHQLGYQPHGFTNQPVPRLVEALEGHAFVVQVACGQSHTIALTDKGSLYSWGTSKSGQCGQGERGIYKTPKKIPQQGELSGVKFVDVSCGDKHTVALSTRGTVWSFGCCAQGQLGLDLDPGADKDALKPTEVKSLDGVIITSVVCGSIHTAMVSDEGQIYLCGFGEHFYPNEDQNFFHKPVLIPFHERVIQIACGQSHIITLTDKGDVYTWGSGSYGQLGQGVKGDLNTPRLVLTGKSVAQVSAGRYHSVALTSFGTLYTWGCGENGQLGHQSDTNVVFPKVLEPNIGTVVGQVACGEHHTAVLTSTPWNKADPEVMDWLAAEREEYALKLKFIKRSNHGLVKKDLLRIAEKMNELKKAWAEEKKLQDKEETEELRRDVASVKTRSVILSDMMREKTERELNGNNPNASSSAMGSPTSATSSSWDSDPPQFPSMSSSHYYDEKEGTAEYAVGAAPSPLNHTASTSSFSFNNNNNAGGSTTQRRSRPSSGQLFAPRPKPLTSSRPASQGANGEFSSTQLGATQTLPLLGQQTYERQVAVVGSNAARCAFLRESAAMVRRMKAIISDTGDTSSEGRLKKTIQLVFGFRKDYDTLRNLTRKKVRTLEAIQRKVNSLRKNNDSHKSRRKINELLLNALEMKLSTVTIKITETEENRKNYALNIAHLKEEELERYYQLEALRKIGTENDAFTRKMNEMKLHSLEEKDRAELELAEFKREIAAFHAFIGDQLNKFHAISHIAQLRKEKREQEKNARVKKVHEKIAHRVGRLQKEMEEKSKEAVAMAQQLESVNERLRYFEKRFQQVAAATGLTNPDAIINKFTLKEEIKQELSEEIRHKQSSLESLQHNLQALTEEMEAAKSTFAESKWKDVDALYEVVHDSEARMNQSKADADRLEERMAYVREGLLAVLNMLPLELTQQLHERHHEGHALSSYEAELLKAIESQPEINHEKTVELINLVSDKLVFLAQQVNEAELLREYRAKEAEEQRRAAEAAHQQRLAAEIAEKMKVSNLMRRSAAQHAAAANSRQDDSLDYDQDRDHGDGRRDDDDDDDDNDDDDDDLNSDVSSQTSSNAATWQQNGEISKL